MWFALAAAFTFIGLAYVVYGKKRAAYVPLICGLILMVFPYAVEDVMVLAGIGIALVLTPFFLRG